MYNLSLSCMNRDVGIVLGGLIGEVKKIDSRSNGDCLGKFLRVRAMVDTLAPLKRGLRVALGDCEDLYSILLCYERLLNFVTAMEEYDIWLEIVLRQGLV
ncbi:hypothetical protein ACOSQ3_012337 [Xanthoceras sorbifolium]